MKLIRSSWSRITRNIKLKAGFSTDFSTEAIVEDVESLSLSRDIPLAQSTRDVKLPSSSVWIFVNPLFRGLLHLSRLYAHHGMFQETTYYAEQAYKLVNFIGSETYVARSLTAQGGAWLYGGILDKASDLLMRARDLTSSSQDNQTSVVLNCHLASLHKMLEDRDAELEAFSNASKTLEILRSVDYINCLDYVKDSTAIIGEELSRLAIKPRKGLALRKVTTGKRTVPKKTQASSRSLVELCISVFNKCILVVSLRGFFLRQKAEAFMSRNCSDEAIIILKEAEGFPPKYVDSIDQSIAMAKQLLLQSLEEMTVDSVYSVLQNSTISFPSILSSNQAIGPTSERSLGMRSSPKKVAANQSARARQISKIPSFVSLFDKLR